MAFYGYTEQPKNYGHIAAAGTILGGAIQQLPAAQDAADKRKLLQDQLKQLKLDSAKAEEIRQQRVAEAVVEYKEALGLKDDEVNDRLITKMEASFYSPAMGEEITNPSKAIMRWSDADSKLKDYLTKEAIKKYRSETQTREEQVIGGPAGTTRVEPALEPTPQRGLEADYLKGAQNNVLAARTIPSVEGVPNSQERREIAGRMGIVEEPEVKSNIQQTSDVETGEAYQPGLNRAEYLSREGASGRVGGLSKEIGEAVPSEQQIMANKRLENASRQRAEAAAERNKIARWRAAIQQGTATVDQRREILDSQAKLEVKKLELQIRVKALQNVITEKAGKTDPGTYLPLISQEEEVSSKQELALLMADMREWEDINTDYEGLLKEKGGTVTTRTPKYEQVKKPKFLIKSVK